MQRPPLFRCETCLVRSLGEPVCRSCGTPWAEGALGLDGPRGTSIALRALGAASGGLLALILGIFELESHVPAGALVVGVPLALGLATPAIVSALRWASRLLRPFDAGGRPPLRAAPRSGITTGDHVTIVGRVRVERAPLAGQLDVAAAARADRVVAGRFRVACDDGTEILVDDTDVELRSARITDRLRDRVEVREGDEVRVSGPVRVLDGDPAGYREGGRKLAFHGAELDPVRIVRLGDGREPERAPEAARRPAVRVPEVPPERDGEGELGPGVAGAGRRRHATR